MMEAYDLLKLTKKELFIIAGYNENYSVYKFLIEPQKEQQDGIYKKLIIDPYSNRSALLQRN